MKAKPQSTIVANDFKQGLLKLAIAQISKREFLFKNMNIYSLGQLSNVIQEVNGQQFLTVSSNQIPQTDDFDANPIDNMMSMCDLKLIPTQVSQDSQSQSTTKRNQLSHLKIESKAKNHKLVIVDLQQEKKTQRQKMKKIQIKKQDYPQDTRQIGAFRVIKQRQHEERLRSLATQTKKKPQASINLNNQRVMFSYDSKIIKLDKMKQRQYQNISQLSSKLTYFQQQQSIKKRYESLKNSKTPTQIKNKVNVTQQELEEQRQKQSKYRRYQTKIGTSAQTATPLSIIKVNPESAKQHQQAISIKSSGIKIIIQQKQFSLEKSSSRPKLNRRITRSQYLKIKSNQQIKQIFKDSNASLLQQSRINPEDKEHSQTIEEKKSKRQAKKRKAYLIPNQFGSKSQKSKIMTYSLQGKAELMKQAKQRPNLFQNIQQKQPKRNQLSTIDKYNLLYLKFKGNPPIQASEQIISELQSQSKVLKSKPSLHTVYSKKSSIKRQNRLIKKLA